MCHVLASKRINTVSSYAFVYLLCDWQSKQYLPHVHLLEMTAQHWV